MEVFCTFKAVKKILKAAAFGMILANAQQAMGTNYTWNNTKTSGNWSDSTNWTPAGTPGKNDTAYFTGSAVITVTLTAETKISNLNFNTEGDSLITIDLNGNDLKCGNTLMLVAKENTDHDSNVTIKGSGTLTTKTFDFPSSKIHTFTIENESTIIEITDTLWGDSTGKLVFTGQGYLYMPNGGAKVNSAPANIDYTGLNKSHRLPYSGGSSTYSCSITTLPDFSTTTKPAVIEFSGGDDSVRVPFKVSISGSGTYTLNGTPIPTGTYYGNKYTSYNPDGTVSDDTWINGNSNIVLSTSSYTLALTSAGITEAGEGITIIFYSPDAYDPDESFMELGRITWYFKTPTWTGQGNDNLWTNKDNWSYAGISSFDPADLSAYDITISETNSSKWPEINSDVSVKSLTITTDTQVTQSNGKFSTSLLSTGTTTGKFIQNNGTLEIRNNGTTDAKIQGYENCIKIKNLSVAEGAKFKQPFDMDLTMLTLTAGSSFSKGPDENTKYNLKLGWLMVATDNYSGISSPDTPDITLKEEFEADSIIILLRNGNITAKQNLTAKKDFIIGGASYNDSSIPVKYEHFVKRPSDWVRSWTNYEDSDLLYINGSSTESSTFYLNSGVEIRAGTSGQGNFYINGAKLVGADSTNKNKIIIPQNDTPTNFCAEAIHSHIENIKVVCSTDNSDDGSKAQIPYSGNIALVNCKNFDDVEFGITSAETATDNRIYVKFDKPIRNSTGELNISEIINSINIGTNMVSYGYVTATYNSKTGTSAPDDTPSEVYFVSSTTWNTDASSETVGSGKYSDSHGRFKRVKPSFYIPQFVTDIDGNVKYGYLITDKWGKRLKPYTDTSYTSVEDGIPDSEKIIRLPPSFAAVLSAVGSNKISLTFSNPIVTDSSKITYWTDENTQVTISHSMKYILPRCFEIFSIKDDGTHELSDLQIDKNVNAEINQFSSGLSSITLQLNRNVTFDDIKKLYLRLCSPKDDAGDYLYPQTRYDYITGQNDWTVSFIQECDEKHIETGQNYMTIHTAHTISDFAVNSVNSSYAYISNTKSEDSADTDFFKTVYGSNTSAVHDFSKSQKNYGTLPYGYEISIVSKVNTGLSSPSESDYPPVIKLFASDTPITNSLFNIFNQNYDQSVFAWLPYTEPYIYSINEFHSYTENINSRRILSSGNFINNKASNGYIFKIGENDVSQTKAGSQISFLYELCESTTEPINHYLSPYCVYAAQKDDDNDTYDLSRSQASPLFAFSLTNADNLLSLTPWYITLKSITEQRGGVTILNNVINAANGEKTVLKVNMPSSGNLDVMVMTLDGNIVKYLTHGSASAGEHFYYWDGKNNAGSAVARGMYFVIVKAPGIDETRKVMVVK